MTGRTACHLDLVQWATDPMWGRIKDRSVRKDLLALDVPFLHQQLMNSTIKHMLVNGSSVMRQLIESFRLNIQSEQPIHRANGSITQIYSGLLFDKIRVL